MPNTYVLPYIVREDYDNFREDVGCSLPERYTEWSAIFANEVDAARNSGKTVLLAPINYDEFREDCRTQGLLPNHKTLIEFTATQRPLATA